ncbi:VCBS repeat-containing protein [candidate division KSB1 bacterium]|nr:VCBS repeat-containing protein [candidate division KSB1 bacterium]
MDLFVTNIGNNFLYNNNGDGSFTKVSEGIVVSDGGNSYASCWADFDRDGYLDLFVANSGGQDNALYLNRGDGSFAKITTGYLVNDARNASGCGWADYDNDGDSDIFVAYEDGPNILYQNNGNENHWLNITCMGTASNRSAIGAKVRAKALIGGKPVWQLREISGQTGFGSQNSLNVEFGFGDADIIDSLVVVWPSGLIQVWEDIQANQFLTLTEGSDAIPVELTLFTAHVNGHDVMLEWITESERNNYGFDIQRTSEQAWERIGFVQGHGTSATRHVYSYKDSDVALGSYRYRLRQIDTDGRSRYSQELEVQIGPVREFSLSQNYPNPFNSATTIFYELAEDKHVTLIVYNACGQQVARLVDEQKKGGRHFVSWDAAEHPSGLYFVRFIAGEYSETIKMMLLR